MFSGGGPASSYASLATSTSLANSFFENSAPCPAEIESLECIPEPGMKTRGPNQPSDSAPSWVVFGAGCLRYCVFFGAASPGYFGASFGACGEVPPLVLPLVAASVPSLAIAALVPVLVLPLLTALVPPLGLVGLVPPLVLLLLATWVPPLALAGLVPPLVMCLLAVLVPTFLLLCSLLSYLAWWCLCWLFWCLVLCCLCELPNYLLWRFLSWLLWCLLRCCLRRFLWWQLGGHLAVRIKTLLVNHTSVCTDGGMQRAEEATNPPQNEQKRSKTRQGVGLVPPGSPSARPQWTELLLRWLGRPLVYT